jgi:hypothetical protein
LPTFRNPVSVPSSKAGSILWGVRENQAIYTVAGYRTGAGLANGNILAQVVGVSGWVGGLIYIDITKHTYGISDVKLL